MTGDKPTFSSRLRDLALALLNATLMLAVLLVFGAWLLLGRVQDFTAETVGAVAENVGGDLRNRLETQTDRVSEALERVASLDDRLVEVADRVKAAPAEADRAAAAELAGLREDLQALDQTLASSGDAAAAPDLAEARSTLTALQSQLDTALNPSWAPASRLDTKTAAEVKDLRQDIQALTSTLQDIQTGLATLRQDTSGSLRLSLRQLLLDLADRIAPPGELPPDTEG